jgi:protein involved in polysaccharide export with SLBB domain
VAVVGAVNAPEEYELVQGERVSDLIELAKGLAEGADIGRAELVRFNEDHISTSILPVHLEAALRGDTEADLRLETDDQLFVRFIPEWHPRRRVTLGGEVEYPGEYTINEGEDTLFDLIQNAGGFTEDASLADAVMFRTTGAIVKDPEFDRLKGMSRSDMTDDEYEYFKMKAREYPGRMVMVVDFRRLFEEGDMSQNVFLLPGDAIDVPASKQTVKVSGQVAHPGAVLYDPSYGVLDYIVKAGGYGWNAQRGRTRVIRGKTGEWLDVDEVKRIDPGDTIWVPEKPHRDLWALVIEIMGVLGEAATIYLLLSSIGK